MAHLPPLATRVLAALAVLAALPGAAGPLRAGAAEILILEPATIGTRIPDFTLPDTAGKQVRIADFEGRVTLLTFWSCYTDTCFTTVKVFEDLIARLGPLGLAAPTVCEEIPPALAANGYAGLLARCSAGQVILVDEDRMVRAGLRVHQLPTTIVLDRGLVVREILRGVPPLRDPEFHARLEQLVRTPVAPAPAPVPIPVPGR